jgi:hypothetical protein
MNAWESIAESNIEGALLQCRRGDWSLDDKALTTGRPGGRIVLLMDTTVLGEVLFSAGVKVDQRVGRPEDGFEPAKKLEPGWSPSTSIVCVGASDDIRDRIMTFRSSSWGGRRAFNALAPTYWRFRQRAFPIVYLDTVKKDRSGNDVIDPLFVVDRWVPRETFAAPSLPKLENAAPAPKAEPPVADGKAAPSRETGPREFAPIETYYEDSFE